METNEIFKPLKNYEEDYEVSNLGRVRSIKFENKRILSPSLSTKGYLQIKLCKNSITKMWGVHQLVAMTFLNYDPGRDLVVDHKNTIKTDNRLDNLRLITHRENTSLGKMLKDKTSQYTGVSFHKKTQTWVAKIQIDGISKNLGYFKDEYIAYLAYKNKLEELNMSRIRTINESRVLYYMLNYPKISTQEIATILELRISEVENIIDYLISSKSSNRPPRFIKKTN